MSNPVETIPLDLAVKALVYAAAYSDVLDRFHIDLLGRRVFEKTRDELAATLTVMLRHENIRQGQ